MSDTPNGPEAAADAASQVKMRILAQFIRDLSFENILSQKGNEGDVQPEFSVQVALEPKKRNVEHQYEVGCKYKVTSTNKSNGSTLFALEMDYAGIFHIENVPEEQLPAFLMIECPRLLFPFARRIISDLTRDGGFPPLNLDTIDFVQLYRQTVLQKQKELQAAATQTSEN